MSTNKRLEKEVTLNANPERVWHAVSTAEGFSTWFVPHYIDDDGNLVSDFGSGNTSTGTLVDRDEGHRIVYASNNDGTTETLEFIIEGQDTTTVLRLIHSGDLGEDWEIDNHSHGWDMFFHNLRLYLENFAGKPVINVLAMIMGTPKRSPEVWDTIYRELNIDPNATIGDTVTATTPDELPPIHGIIDLKAPGLLGIRSKHGLHRFGGGGADSWGMVNVVHYYYGVDIDRTTATTAWQAWLDRLFPTT